MREEIKKYVQYLYNLNLNATATAIKERLDNCVTVEHLSWLANDIRSMAEDDGFTL